MSRLQSARDQIIFARKYTLRLLDNTPQEDWYRQPSEGVTHIAWLVGHLVLGQYRLALERIRGRRPEDEYLVSQAFLARHGRGSVPKPDPASDPSPEEIRAVLDRVHRQVLEETATLPEEEWDRPLLQPHSLVSTKIGALFWCGQHEFVHAGQIGLLRRLLGHPPVW
jgi:uncharacterized damage-inducible protein DinB